MKNIKLLDLPPIPETYIKSLDVIQTYKDVFPKENYAHIYSSYVANADLIEYLGQFFTNDIIVRYQVIRKELPVHTDKTSHPTKMNYMIDTGGDVITRWWSSIEEPREIIEEFVQDPNKWYELNIQVPHSITSPVRPRVSITVKINS